MAGGQAHGSLDMDPIALVVGSVSDIKGPGLPLSLDCVRLPGSELPFRLQSAVELVEGVLLVGGAGSEVDGVCEVVGDVFVALQILFETAKTEGLG